MEIKRNSLKNKGHSATGTIKSINLKKNYTACLNRNPMEISEDVLSGVGEFTGRNSNIQV